MPVVSESEECSNKCQKPKALFRQDKLVASLKSWHLWCHGGDNGARTHALWLAKPSLYQLSYVPKEGRPGGEIDGKTGPPYNEGERICPIGAGSGGRTRTGVLLVMSQASCHCSTPRYNHGPTYRVPGPSFYHLTGGGRPVPTLFVQAAISFGVSATFQPQRGLTANPFNHNAYTRQTVVHTKSPARFELALACRHCCTLASSSPI